MAQINILVFGGGTVRKTCLLMIDVKYRILKMCQKLCKEMVLMELLLLGLLALGKVV